MLHFAPRYGRAARQLTGCPAAPLRAANDNAANDTAIAAEQDEDVDVLVAALRLFAAHGLSAARHAEHRAELAARLGDDGETAWWLAVCRMLDRRLAHDLAARQARGLWPAKAS